MTDRRPAPEDLTARISALEQELTDALEQQTATAEVLRIISRSPTDLQPVLDAICERAARLCGVDDAIVHRVEGDTTRPVAHFGSLASMPMNAPQAITAGGVNGRAILERRTVYLPDFDTVPEEEYPVTAAMIGTVAGVRPRSFLAVPLLREGAAIGTFFLRRREPHAFSDKQIALLQTFADQAAIAIANTRLFEELQTRNRDLAEALEHQTATGEVLEIISQSPTDVQPVLDAIVQRARTLGEADHASIMRIEGDEQVRWATTTDWPLGGRRPAALSPVAGVAIREQHTEQHTVHLAERTTEYDEELVRRAQELSGVTDEPRPGSNVYVPLTRDGVVIALLVVMREQVQPFRDKQIALLETFAAQAVIAIENTRLFAELQESNATLREALEQQTATAEVLRVIASAPTDLQQVLDTILTTAHRLVDVSTGALYLYDGEVLRPAAAAGPRGSATALALLQTQYAQTPLRPGHGRVTEVAALERRIVHVPDMRADPHFAPLYDPRPPGAEQARTALAVPLLRAGQLEGVIFFLRRVAQPFTDEQIALVQTFADQAVIAIENARLFEEVQSRTRELEERNTALGAALEQQTAMAEVLRVIAGAPTDLQQVLDTILASAHRLVDVNNGGLFLYDGDVLQAAAGVDAESFAQLQANFGQTPMRPQDGLVVEVAALERRTIHVPDVRADPRFASRYSANRRALRTALAVPLLQTGELRGVIFFYRTVVQPFTDEQIALIETFADQAVIAIENTRLFQEIQDKNRELGEALEQQTATAEVLKVISSSPENLDASLQAVADTAVRLCRAAFARVWLRDGEGAVRGPGASPTGIEYGEPGERLTFSGREHAPFAASILTGHIVHAEDLQRYAEEHKAEYLARLSRRTGMRTQLSVPLLRGTTAIGALIFGRGSPEPNPFTAREIALAESFAAQAVIAIENARLFEEIQRRTQELEAASGAKSEFLSRMSHELRTPLNAVIGFAEIMEMDPATTLKQHERVGHILRGGRHLLGLINEVLDIARIEAGRLSLSLEPVALDAVLGEVLELIRPIAIDADVDLQAPDPPALHVAVQADKGRLRQIILKLITNGVKYNHAGGSVTLTSGEGPDGLRRLTVSDTGPGITADAITHLFAPFERLSADQSGVEGTGLGLAIAKRLAQAMGGDIGVESVVGQGSVFWLDLPAAPLPPGFLSEPEDETGLTAANGAARAATVLYIEDNLPNVELVQHILGFRSGVTLLTAPRAEVGLRLASRYLPDLILLDLNLPDLQGDEALARLRADPRTAAIPVVMVSADATETQIQRLLAAGARDYLTKPLDVKRFLALVDEVTAGSGERGAGSGGDGSGGGIGS